ncbi:glucose receptor git3 [Pyrenophora seminiperda CCB06]|uniref:Glucose receptor git3 n=1 Tax=Pyrenophora seminiperda CCB06 TaxID=1302712 RepID=A0A3M7M7G1_9PLEO|nr:glucose receptor git3 [Pyrenophora seminiperda CCB06]
MQRTNPSGLGCTINGWVGQWSVQAADFSILAIAIITLLTITRTTYMPDTCLWKKILICASVWFVPTTTVSGNWCWISGQEPALRYVLGHGWRFSIIIATIGIYIYIWTYMNKHYKMLNLVTTGESYTHQSSVQRREFRKSNAFDLQSESQMELHQIHVEHHVAVKHSEDGQAKSPNVDLEANDSCRSGTTVSVTSENDTYTKDTSAKNMSDLSASKNAIIVEDPRAMHVSNPSRDASQSRNVEREIKRMLLLNAYPILYIILWTPGILNRLVEASGHKSRVLAIMQCSTQYIGFANAITYGFNKHLRKLVVKDLNRLSKR